MKLLHESILNSLNVPVVAFDMDGMICFTNAAAREFVEPGEATLAFGDVFHGECWLKIVDQVRALSPGQVKVVAHEVQGRISELRLSPAYDESGAELVYVVAELIVEPDGSTDQNSHHNSHHNSHYNSHHNSHQNSHQNSGQDTTGLEYAERVLRDSTMLFRSFMDHVPAFVYVKDQHHIYQFVNNMIHEMGKDSLFNTDGMVGNTAAGVFPAEMAERMNQEDEEIVRTRVPMIRDLTVPMTDGSLMHLEGIKFPISLGSETLVGGFYTDVTARRQSDVEKERLLSAIEQSGEMILIVDGDGMVIYCNPVFSEVTGYSREEVIGQNNRVWQSGLHDQTFYDDVRAVLNEGKSWHGRMINKRKDGSLINEDVTISPVLDNSGNPVHYVLIKRDITRELELEERLAHAQRMESIGTLAGGVAHDYNNVLQTILGNTEIVLEEFKDHSEVLMELVGEIKSAAEQSAVLTSQLLAFARKQVIKPRAINLNDEFANMRNMLARLIGSNVELIWQPADDLWNVHVDPAQMNQIFTNICVNARDAIMDVGSLTVSMRNVPEAECENLPFGRDHARDYVCVLAQDNGCGMSAEQVARAFEPFFTTKPLHAGTGLGLSTVYGIVKQNDGFIYVASSEGEGTTVTIYLPRYPGDVQGRENDEKFSFGAGMKQIVLVVEDEASILKLIQRSLDRLGYNVITANGPDEALARAASIDHIDLVISDVIMPQKNGKDLVVDIKASHPEVNVLFMSGYTADVLNNIPGFDQEECFIQKPFNIAQLATKVERLLKRAS